MLLTVLLAAAAAGLLTAGPGRGPRLRAVLPPAARPGRVGPVSRGPAPRPAGARAPARRSVAFLTDVPLLACAGAGAAVLLVVGGLVGAVMGLAVVLAGPRLLSRLESGAARREREQLAQDLPLALDLLAACLAGGAPLPSAVVAVAAALPGTCGDRLRRTGAALAVGSAPEEAWAALREGEDPDRPVAAAAVRALVRASEGGAPVAAAVSRLAADARAEARGRAEQAARRAGVLAVAPLGLCFLPAFVLLGIVPVVVGLAGPLLAGL